MMSLALCAAAAKAIPKNSDMAKRESVLNLEPEAQSGACC
jgi:hypothetical protein